jgi:short-subunit dehydrogenase
VVFKGKIVLITGASSGLGAALGRAFARRGAAVALLARRADRLKVLAAGIRKTGGRAVAVPCDVTQDASVRRAARRVRATLGSPHIVVANAGFEVTGPFERLMLDDYRRQFETNVFGVLRTVYATIADLKRTRGHLVFIGSVLGHIALPGTTAYAMSKFAVTALAEGLRFELRPAHVTVVLIAPGNVTTDIRKVDNADRLHPDLADPIPAWLRIPADRAAEQILAAVSRGQRERVLTKVAKVAVTVQRHVPELVSFVIGAAHLKGRAEPR